MCVIILAWKVHPDYPLILIANRDEYFARHTLAAAPWAEDSTVFGGRDSVRGGTWLGINQDGRLAAVTNYRSGPLRDDVCVSPKSRGALTANWLLMTNGNSNSSDTAASMTTTNNASAAAASAFAAQEYLQSIRGADYDGYNLIVGNMHSGLWVSSNVVDNGAIHQVEPGIHGVANQYFNAPHWPKVETAKKNVEALLLLEEPNIDDEDLLVERLFEILGNDKLYDKELLPDTGIDVNMERLLSSMFVKADDYDYGTRASTVILARKDRSVRFVERTLGRDHKVQHEAEHRIPGDDV